MYLDDLQIKTLRQTFFWNWGCRNSIKERAVWWSGVTVATPKLIIYLRHALKCFILHYFPKTPSDQSEFSMLFNVNGGLSLDDHTSYILLAESCHTSIQCCSSFLIWNWNNCTISVDVFYTVAFIGLYFNCLHLEQSFTQSLASPLIRRAPGLTPRFRFLNDLVYHRGGLVKTFASLLRSCPSDRGPVVILARTNTSVIVEPITAIGGSNGVISFTLDISSRVRRDIINP